MRALDPEAQYPVAKFSFILHFAFVPSQEPALLVFSTMLSQLGILQMCREHSACRNCLCMAMHCKRATLISAELHANACSQKASPARPSLSRIDLVLTGLYQTWNFKLCTYSGLHRLFSHQALKNQKLIFRTAST